MKRLTIVFVVAVLAGVPAQAQEARGDMKQGMTLLEQGTRLLLEGFLKELGNAKIEFQGRLLDLNAYKFPEILPNGDIIIRRKVPLVPGPDAPDVPAPGEGGEIEL